MAEEQIMVRQAQRFEEIIKLRGFVDRTLLLKEFLDSNKCQKDKQVMIFAPSKFGKTINLDMIRLFCNIERDKDGNLKRNVTKEPTEEELASSEVMKIFRRDAEDPSAWCKILTETEFVKKHFGRHPVVILDLKELEWKNEKEALFSCAMLVHQAYLEHKYLRNSPELSSEIPDYTLLKQSCQAWCNYSEDELTQLLAGKIYKGFKKLFMSLHVHWKRYPILLFDEVDSPTVQALIEKVSGDEIQKIGRVISKLIFRILKSSGRTIVEGALITGISYLGSVGLSPLDNTAPVYHLADDRFSQYYGLTDAEVHNLMNGLFPDSKRDDVLNFIKTHYNGYHQINGGARFCLYSVLSYINQKHENKNDVNYIFWKEVGLIQNFSALLRNSFLMKDIQTLLSDDDDYNSIKIKFCQKVDVNRLLGTFDEKQMLYRNEIFSFFMERGFLTYNPNKPTEGLEIYVKIPNCEVKFGYDQMFRDYFPLEAMDARADCGEFLRNMSPDVDKLDEDFRINLEKFHKNLQEIFSNVKCPHESSVSALMWIVMKDNAGYDQCYKEFPIKERDKNGKVKVIAKIDLWMKRGDFAVIWEFKQNQTARSGNPGCKEKSAVAALEDIMPPPPGKVAENPGSTKAVQYIKALEEHHIRKHLFVGFSVDGDHKVHLRLLANSKNWNYVISLDP